MVLVASIDLSFTPTVPVCRGTPRPDSHDEHLDSAERHSSGNCNEEGASAAA